MVKIPQDAMKLLNNALCFVATVDSQGAPNVVPKGNIAVLDDNTLVFADLYSHQTKENLAINPDISIAVVNPASYTGYQLKGKAEIIERGKEYDDLSKRIFGQGQLEHIEAKYAVKIKVSKVIDIGYTRTADKEI